MNRRNLFPALAGFAAAATASTASAAENNPLMDLLAASMKEKKGVSVYVNGQQIGMLVTGIGLEFVEGRSQAQSKIVIRLTSIDAVTMA
ncbi:MAG TPA: hypothetical protein VFQ91_16155 [Bryobacteraceae bacterium]|nr:hypothetical protein [Bryobacteraceae bacterium]